jgi:hypothetical protein
MSLLASRPGGSNKSCVLYNISNMKLKDDIIIQIVWFEKINFSMPLTRTFAFYLIYS